MEHLDSSHEDNFAVDSIESSNSDIKSILQDETTNKMYGKKYKLNNNVHVYIYIIIYILV